MRFKVRAKENGRLDSLRRQVGERFQDLLDSRAISHADETGELDGVENGEDELAPSREPRVRENEREDLVERVLLLVSKGKNDSLLGSSSKDGLDVQVLLEDFRVDAGSKSSKTVVSGSGGRKKRRDGRETRLTKKRIPWIHRGS